MIMSVRLSLFIGESFISSRSEVPVQQIDDSRFAPVVPSPVVPSMDFSSPTLPSFDFDRLTEDTDSKWLRSQSLVTESVDLGFVCGLDAYRGTGRPANL